MKLWDWNLAVRYCKEVQILKTFLNVNVFSWRVKKKMFIFLKSLRQPALACIIDKVDYLRWDGKLLLLIQVIPMEYVTITESDDNPLKPAVSGRFF